MTQSRYFVFLPALLCAFLWGSALPAIKLVYIHWESAGLEIAIWDRWLFAGVRFVIAGAALLLISRDPWTEWRATPKRYLLVLSLSQTLVQYIFLYIALSLSSGSLVALMASTGSIWWMLLAPMMLGAAWPKFRQWCGLVLGVCGVGLAVHAPGAGAGHASLGAACMLVSAFMGAVGVIVFTKIKPTMGARAATGFGLVLGGLGLCLLGLPSWGKLTMLFDGYVLGVTVWLVLVSATAFALWNHLSTIFPVPLLASCRFLIPVFGVNLSLLLLPGESAGWGLVVGGVLVIGSMLYATLSKAD